MVANLVGKKPLLGLSTHSLAQAKAAVALAGTTLDYCAIGPLFPTLTKPDYPPVGLSLARQVQAFSTDMPIFGIGGVNETTLDAVLATGLQRVAIVSAILCADDLFAAVRRFKERLIAHSSTKK